MCSELRGVVTDAGYEEAVLVKVDDADWEEGGMEEVTAAEEEEEEEGVWPGSV